MGGGFRVPAPSEQRTANRTPITFAPKMSSISKGAWMTIFLLALVTTSIRNARADQSCDAEPTTYDYSRVVAEPRNKGIAFEDLPGFTRSFYNRDHALITPESRVWAGYPGWTNTLTAHLISPGSGAHFTMYIANMAPESSSGPPADPSMERFAFVLEGTVAVQAGGETSRTLTADHYVYFPPGMTHSLASFAGAKLVIFERVYGIKDGNPKFQVGTVDSKPHLPTAGEVFQLRKLMPASSDYDFNIHIMDFKPGEHLNVKEVHYNQHGLLLLQGKGIYRLADNWFPIQAGDAIYMGPFVPQWYAALGYENSRYILYKDTTVDPLMTP